MTLVALLALTTQAWAEDTTLFELNGSTATTGTLTLGTDGVEAGTVKIHQNTDEIAGIRMNSDYNLAGGKYFTIKPATGSFKAGDKLSIAVCYSHNSNNKNAKAAIYAADGKTLLYTTANGINGLKSADDPAVEEYVLTQDADLLYIGRDGNTDSYVTTLKVVRPASATPVALTWDATANTATLTNGMPAGNVTVNVDYFPQAELAMSTDATPVALAPTAINDVPANTDAPIVTPGTVANIGQSEVPQGRLMYYASQTEMTDDDLLALAADKWSPDVPTATDLAQGDAYVYYYIQGAEPATIAERTDANTCSDGDILAANVVPVTLDAEPTYTVSLNKTGMAEGEPALWSAKSTNVTTEVNLGEADLEGVKKSETVTVTYTGQRKVIGVKAEKKSAAPAGLTLDLATVTEATTVEDGYTVTGTLGANVKISIANGATVTLDGVNINGEGDFDYECAGITCLGDATIILKDNTENTVKGFYENYPGIHVPENNTLTIQGPGTLEVTGAKGDDGWYDWDNEEWHYAGDGGAAISGNIIVEGGAVVTATGGTGGYGGTGDSGGTGGTGGVAISGNIIVQGGATVTATGGNGGNGGYGEAGAGGPGGTGGNAFAGTLTYKGGTVTANGGSGGSGGESDEGNGSSGSAGKAFANPVDFTQATVVYTLTDGSNTITTISNQKTVVISE